MRSTMIRLSSLVLLAVLAWTPAAPPAPAAPAQAAPTAPQLAAVQRLVIGFPNLSPSLDPQLSANGTYRKYDLFETLVLFDDNLQVVPAVATQWKLVDPTTWRFTLRSDAKFHDGTALTARDV